MKAGQADGTVKDEVMLTGSNVTNIEGNGLETIIYTRSGSLAISTTATILSLPTAAVLEALEFSTNIKDQVRIIISNRRASGTFEYIGSTNVDGGGTIAHILPSLVNLGGSAILTETKYDDTTKFFKMRLSRPITFPSGLKVEVQNISATTAYNAAVIAAVRKLR